ncbi:hypothetical protein DL771_009998 [Monosporascus sp. 5C6A]|nr:hypothetical protein DL771_009998 [Monosporascus sp. 5C6A]
MKPFRSSQRPQASKKSVPSVICFVMKLASHRLFGQSFAMWPRDDLVDYLVNLQRSDSLSETFVFSSTLLPNGRLRSVANRIDGETSVATESAADFPLHCCRVLSDVTPSTSLLPLIDDGHCVMQTFSQRLRELKNLLSKGPADSQMLLKAPLLRACLPAVGPAVEPVDEPVPCLQAAAIAAASNALTRREGQRPSALLADVFESLPRQRVVSKSKEEEGEAKGKGKATEE